MDSKTFRTYQRRAVLSAAIVAGAGGIALGDPFYTGADVSLLTFMQQQGVAFKDNGTAANGDQILYDAGANLFRLRLFVNPQTTYTNTNVGAIQTQAYDINLAQQIKADDPAAKILLDFHYSDTWGDPGHQTKPSAWTGDATLATLETDVTNYTTSTLSAFKSAGVLPDMVQVGNETTDGMLWQTGSSGAAAVGGRILYQNTTYKGLGLTNNEPTQAQTNQSWANFGGILNAAIAGVRAVQVPGQHIPIALSIDSGDLNDQPQSFFSNIQTLGGVTDFDIEGVDYYPSSDDSQKSFSYLTSNLKALANTNTNNGANLNPSKKIMLLETDYPYMGTANSDTEPITNPYGTGVNAWPATPAGQQQEFLDVRNLMNGLPGNDGEGVLYWYPEAVQVNPYNINNGGNTALFDANGNALSALSSTSGAFNVTGTVTATWVKNQNADWNTTGNWLGGVIPNGVGAEADLLATISAPRTLSSSTIVTLGSLYFNNADSYTLSGTGSLTMSAVSGSTALIDVIAGSHTINLPITIASNTTFNIAAGALQITAPITVNSGENFNITLQSGAAISFAGSFHAASLSLASGASANITAHGTNPATLVQLDSLAFGGSTGNWLGKLDLSNNEMIVHGGVLNDIANQLKTGSSGYWKGSSGIVSTTAAADSSFLTTIGYRTGGVVFDGVNTTTSDVLLRYTYYGDANLDGVVDGADYQQIDQGYGSNGVLTGWQYGDFNYDGVIDGSDYALIDNAFNQLTANPGADPLAITASPTAIPSSLTSQSIPDPMSPALLGVAAFGLASRRRARRR